MTRTLACGLLIVLAAACGSKKSAPSTPAPAKADQPAAHDMHDMHAMMAKMDQEMAGMPPAMAEFHHVLAPHWHADKGPQRTQGTCAALPDFHRTSDALAQAAAPEHAKPEAWTASTKALTDAVGGLEAACKANDPGTFEVAFAKVHDSFHGVMAAAGIHMDMGMHEEMEYGEAHEGMAPGGAGDEPAEPDDDGDGDGK